jgi:hypothetical protein
LFDLSRREAYEKDVGLRLKLRVQAPDLSVIPWEFLYDEQEDEYLALARSTPVVRYLELPQPLKPLTVTPPLRILGMIASPRDQDPLDTSRERKRLEDAVKPLQEEGRVALTWIEGETWRDLQRAMRNGEWNVFHFIGHGAYDEVKDEGLIALADDGGRTQLLSAGQLGRLLDDHGPLRLAVLNSCEGARGGPKEVLSSTAAVLMRRGVPAVVAMQYEITDRAAIEFTRAFYEAIADGQPVDGAVSEARIAVSLALESTLEWGVPVLYMHAPDGCIFSVEPGTVPTNGKAITPPRTPVLEGLRRWGAAARASAHGGGCSCRRRPRGSDRDDGPSPAGVAAAVLPMRALRRSAGSSRPEASSARPRRSTGAACSSAARTRTSTRSTRRTARKSGTSRRARSSFPRRRLRTASCTSAATTRTCTR